MISNQGTAALSVHSVVSKCCGCCFLYTHRRKSSLFFNIIFILKISKKKITIFYYLTISVRLSVVVNLLIFRSFEMGSGLCRNTGKRPRAVQEFDGLYRKIVFNYAKQVQTDLFVLITIP